MIILGSGPAALTAAVYTTRGNMNTLVIAGSQYGGQLMLTTEVENYPGFPQGVQGPDLMDMMIKQAERFNAEFIYDDATDVDFKSRPFKVFKGEDVYEGRTIVVATGASARWLGLESEKRLLGRGVSSCATCDGHFFKDKDVLVVGGGDSAMEEALFLSRMVNSIRMIHRRDELRASKIMQDRVVENSKIDFIWDSVVVEILGEQKVSGAVIENVKTAEKTELECDGVFVAIGHKPNTAFLKGKLELDRKGYIKVQDHTKTSVEGVFVGGDVHDYRYRQAVTAAGFGCMAGMDAEKWLEEQA
ncbi:MAG: thioredoxin-disulfide reductase [Thermoplasmata archaeon]